MEQTNLQINDTQKCGVDIAKFLCAILVVCIHTHPLQYGTTADYFFNCFCRIAVPFFFISSSYFYYTRGGNIKSYLRRLLVLYLCWFIIEIPFTIKVFFIDSDDTYIINLIKFVRGVLINNSFFASWFLTALMEGMLIIHFLEKRGFLLSLIGCVCFILALFWSMWYGLVRGTWFEHYFHYFGLVVMPANSFIIAIPYLIIGKLFAENRIPKIPLPFCAVFLLLAILEVYICRDSFNRPFDDVFLSLIPLSIILFQSVSELTFNETSQLYPICSYLRKSSILIYLLHPIFIYIFTWIGLFQEGSARDSILLFLAVLSCSVICAFGVISLSNKYGFLKKMY